MVSSSEKRLIPWFASYAEYHSNWVNQLIHVICVPLILSTGFVCLLDTTLPIPGIGLISVSAMACAMYVLWYAYISPGPIGVTAVAMVCGLFYGAQATRDVYGADAWKPALAVHVVCWILQFIGHGVFEGRAPALLDNLFQALFMAPIFVLIEVLMSLGLLSSFKKEAIAETSRRIAAFRKARKIAA